MKLYLPFLLIVLLSGCGQTTTALTSVNEPIQKEVMSSESPEVKEDEQTTTETPNDLEADLSMYAQWAIDEETLQYNLVRSPDLVDCASVLGGQTGGGDLLSTLIVDTATRDMLNLDVYSVEYIKSLEKNIAQKSQQLYKQNFYAFFICHLGDGVDVVAGYLNFSNEITSSYKIGEEPTLAIVNNGAVTLYQDIQLINNTATGAEVEACTPELVDNAIKWTCFEGLIHEGDYSVGSSLKEWTIPLDGGTVSARDYELLD